MSIWSTIKSWFSNTEVVEKVETAPVVTPVKEEVKQVVDNKATKEIETRLAEVAEEKVTAKEIKAKVKKTSELKAEKPAAKKPAAKKPATKPATEAKPKQPAKPRNKKNDGK